MMTISVKIKERMDQLQKWMESNHHIDNPDQVYELTMNVSKFWSALTEEDRDYVQAAQHAIEDKIVWKI
jgi:hypothetical protein|tara:strand:+ start:2288 stop:2494 length:207 start_codon:yes stop_codon:yes gene_type:complete